MKRIIKLIILCFLVIIQLLYAGLIKAQVNTDSLITQANAYVYLGNDLLTNNNFLEAEEAYFKSVDTWLKNPVFHAYSAYPHFQLADLYRSIGSYDKSIEQYTIAEKILLNANEDFYNLLGGLYNNIGYFYINFGDYQKSIEYYRRASDVLEPIKIGNEYLYSDAILGLAQCLHYQRKYQQSIDLVKTYLKTNKVNTPSFRILLGNTYCQYGDYAKSISIINEALKEYEDNPSEYAQYLLYLTDAYIRNKELDNAQKALDKALPILQKYKSEHDPWMVFYYEIYGQYLMKKAENEECDYDKLANYTEAVNVFDKALILNSSSTNNSIPYLDDQIELITPRQVKDVFVNRALALKEIGNVYQNQNDQFTANIFYDKALKTTSANIKFLHDLRISFLDEESKISLSEQYSKVYLDGIKIADQLYTNTKLPLYFEQMLEFSEAGKSATFLASLNDIKAKNFGGIPDSLVQKEKDLTMRLASLKQLRFNTENQNSPDSSLLAELDKSIFNVQNAHDELIFLFERDYEDFYNFKYKNSTITSADIIRKLKSNQALIEYIIDEPKDALDTGYVYALVFTSKDYHYSKVAVTYEYLNHLQTIIDELSNNHIADTNYKDFKKYTSSAYYLYQTLIQPLALDKRITDLIIIPDGSISYIPFDALLCKPNMETVIDYRRLNYLVYDYSASYSYSAKLHFEYFKSERKHNKSILAYAPDYSEIEVDLNKAAYRNRQVNRTILRPLPGAKDEVLGLAKMQKCKAFIGQEASERSFKDLAVNYDILHLAMHTIINDSIPMFSKLVFSTPSDTIEDGYLNTQEIYNLKLDARLAVLSACNTGTGKLRSGEGVMSLSRAFLYAGCPSIVMTLWEVEDKVSANLMLNFYKYLFKGYSKAEALRKAKMDHIKTADPLKAHPYFWQGYILVGDPSPIKLNNNVIIAILMFSVVLIVLWHFIQRFISIKRKITK